MGLIRNRHQGSRASAKAIQENFKPNRMVRKWSLHLVILLFIGFIFSIFFSMEMENGQMMHSENPAAVSFEKTVEKAAEDEVKRLIEENNVSKTAKEVTKCQFFG